MPLQFNRKIAFLALFLLSSVLYHACLPKWVPGSLPSGRIDPLQAVMLPEDNNKEVLNQYIHRFFEGKSMILKAKQEILKALFNGKAAEEVVAAFKDFKVTRYEVSQDTINKIWAATPIDISDRGPLVKTLQNLKKEPKRALEYKEDDTKNVYFTSCFGDSYQGGFCLTKNGFVQEEQMMLHTGGVIHIEALRKGDPANHPVAQTPMHAYQIAIWTGVPVFGTMDGKVIYEQHLTPYNGGGKIDPVKMAALKQLIQPKKHPTKHNLLMIDSPEIRSSMTGLPEGEFEYTDSLLLHGFQKFYIAYHSANTLEKQGADRKVHILTGNAGTGAFKNNGNVMYVLNILAAAAAGVDLTVYTFNHVGAIVLDNAILLLNAALETLREEQKATATYKDIWETVRRIAPHQKGWKLTDKNTGYKVQTDGISLKARDESALA